MVLMFILYFTVFNSAFLFYFFRSQKEFPKSLREVKFELFNIWSGLRSTIEDIALRKRNRIGKHMMIVCVCLWLLF